MALSQSVNTTNPAFDDLCSRLAKAHSPQETAKHGTAVPVFEVRKVSIIPGFQNKFAEGMCLIDRRGSIIFDPDVAFKEVTGFEPDTLISSDDIKNNEPLLVDCIQHLHKESFSELSETDKWDVLDVVEVLQKTHGVTGYCERVEVVSVHMTPEAAEVAMARTHLEKGEKAYTFVGSKWNEPEYVALISALTSQ